MLNPSKLLMVMATSAIAILSTGNLQATPPMLIQAGYIHNSQSLQLEFDQELDATILNPNGFRLNLGENHPDSLYTVHFDPDTPEITGNQITLDLVFQGMNGTFTYVEDYVEYQVTTWGQMFENARLIEIYRSLHPVKIYLLENIIANSQGEGNLEMSAQEGAPIDLVGDPLNLIDLLSAEFDEHAGILSLTFSEPVRYGMINEDISRGNAPGNGRLDPHEDRNSNGILEFEKAIFLEGISFFTDDDQFALTEKRGWYRTECLTAENSATIQLRLTPQDRRELFAMSEDSPQIRLDEWTFTGLDNRGNRQATLPLTVIPDENPVTVDSVYYDLGFNLLTLYCNSALLGAFEQGVNFAFIKLHTPSENLALTGGDINYADNNQTLRITMTLADQFMIEESFWSYGAENLTLEVEPYMTLGADYGMMAGSIHSINFLPETPAQKAPDPDNAIYYAANDALYLHFDVRLDNNVNPQRIHLSDGSFTTTIDVSNWARIEANRGLMLNLLPACASELELRINRQQMILLLDPFAVYQQTYMNGNRSITAGRHFTVTFEADTGNPLPREIWYESDSNCLVMQCNRLINPATIQLEGFTLNGFPLHPQSYVIDNPSTIRYELNEVDSLALSEQIPEARVSPVIDIAPGVFSSTDGNSNPALIGLTDGMDMSGFGGNYTLLSGWGKSFRVWSSEAFPDEPYTVVGLLKVAGVHCHFYVAKDQLRAYGPNQGFVPVTRADLITLLNLIDNSTPTNPERGVFSRLISLLASFREDRVPCQCEILLADIFDEVGIGQNGASSSYLVGSKYIPGYGGAEDLMILDSHPQLFANNDAAWYWNRYWQYWEPSQFFTGANSLVNLLAHWMCARVDPDEEPWVTEGLALISEQILLGNVSFYGANLTKPLMESLTFTADDNRHLNSRQDLMNSYLFMEYLYEKYGREFLIAKIGSREENGFAGIQAALDEYRSEAPLPDPFQSRTLAGIFLDYSIACLLDTTNGEDQRRYMFENVNLYGITSIDILRWQDTQQYRPPYNVSLDPWSFIVYTTGYGPGYLNPLLDPQGSIYLDGRDNLSLQAAIIRSPEPMYNLHPGDEFIVEEIELNEHNRGEVELSVPGWEFGQPEIADYPTLYTIICLTGETTADRGILTIHNSPDYFFAPTVAASVASATSIRLNFGLPWGELGFGEELQGMPDKHRAKLTYYNRERWFRQLLEARELDNEGSLVGFSVYRSINPEGGFELVQSGITELTYLDENLTTGRTYYYSVTADYENPDGSSEYVTVSARPMEYESMANLACAVSNFGSFGDPNGYLPSVEYPIGSGKYYLWEGRFWVGAIIAGERRVSHADYGNYEWVPSDGLEFSLNVVGSDRMYSQVRYDDYLEIYTHSPIGLEVMQTVSLWAKGKDGILANTILIQVEVTNNSNHGDLTGVYLAWVFDCDIAAGPNGDPDQPYMDDNVEFDAVRGMSYMYDDDYNGDPFDDTGERGEIPGYLGLRLLEAPGNTGVAHHGWWNWEEDPGSDEEKYAFLDGTAPRYQGNPYMPNPADFNASPFDYRFLLSIGPFDLPYGETITAKVGLVMGDGLAELQAHSDALAQKFVGNIPIIRLMPVEFTVGAAFPNPFNPTVTIPFTLPVKGEVEFSLYNLLGQAVYRTSRIYDAGAHQYILIQPFLSSGMYLQQVRFQDEAQIQKLMLVK